MTLDWATFATRPTLTWLAIANPGGYQWLIEPTDPAPVTSSRAGVIVSSSPLTRREATIVPRWNPSRPEQARRNVGIGRQHHQFTISLAILKDD